MKHPILLGITFLIGCSHIAAYIWFAHYLLFRKDDRNEPPTV